MLSVVTVSMAQQQEGKVVLLSTGDSIGTILSTMDSVAVVDSKALQIDSAMVNDRILMDSTTVDDRIWMDDPAAEQNNKYAKRDWNTWTPDPQRALWLAMVIPGAGQIYNRKYWKLPIIYGGFMGCIYALTWNNGMYKDYSQAYLDIMDDDPGTQSYNRFLHLGKVITPENEEQYKTIFKNRKDKYRRWRDLSFFVMLGVYAISVIDAYVDAELSVFDISNDLSLQVAPTTISNPAVGLSRWQAQSVGLCCTLNF